MDEHSSVDSLHSRLAGRSGPIVIDVRGAEEYDAGHVPGALSIPIEELTGRIGDLPRGRPVVAY